MTFSWTDGTTAKSLVAEGVYAPTLPAPFTFEQKGGIYRTYNGHGIAKIVHSKYAFQFDWSLAPEDLRDSIDSMVATRATVLFEDPYLGTYYFKLLPSDVSVGSELTSSVSISAVFREV